MAAKEPYDYISTVTPDYSSTTFNVNPSDIIMEEGEKSSVILIGDDGSEERISLSNTSYFYVTLKWNYKSASDAGTIIDFYHDATKGNGMARSFKWTCPTRAGGHTYVVRFDSKLSRSIHGKGLHSIPDIRLKIVGRIAD